MKATWSRSLTLRLTLLFAVAAAFVLFLLGLLIGNLVEQHFEEQDMEALSGKMALTRHILERDSATQDGAALGRQLDDALTGHHGLAVAVFGADRQVVYANEALTFPPTLLDPQAAARPGRVVKWQAPEGLPWRGISAVVTAGADGRTPFIIAIATEISHHEHFMSGFRGTLWVFIALATLAMGLLGWVVVRRGLAPLQTIKRRAAEITANHLHTRLPAEAIPQELADLADTLNDMLARLEESFQRLSDFSSDLAHELRTPVSNLLTQTQVTLSRARSDDEYRDILASNAEEFERLSRMIADMLFLAKADNQQIIPNRERVEMADEVADLLEFYGLLAEEKAIRVTLSGAGAVTGDRLMLRRAVSNLLSNALRHTPDGPAEHLPRLFDRFYRADSSRQRTTEGSGLGLAITRSILLAHDGEVSVESADQRTRFTLTLPASD
ncbi:MAG: two-component sensor histidine kinase [Betaproteobacteria bacterium HGW-Betaproteobacteria-4]|nr:MAG: two-component sensor histidine kinase [Betaproteobacteria bacterium HGW-Betaproteobacteria-4]